MNTKRWPVLFAALFLIPLSYAATPDITVRDGYVRGLPPGAQNTAAYMTIENHGPRSLTLTGARSSVAGHVSLHETRMQNGQMSMAPVATIMIPADGEVILESGGRHFMLMGLNATLSENDEVDMVLQFEDEQEFQLSLPVRSVLSETAPAGH